MVIIGWIVVLLFVAAPSVLHAQSPPRVYRIASFHVGLDHVPPSLDGLRDGLKTLGYQEGRNLRLDFRNLPDEAAARTAALEIARERPDLIIAFENQTIRAAHAATKDIPVVFLHVTDPVADGVVQSLARPGGNMTGFIALGNTPTKQVELFKQLVPSLRRMLVLTDPDDPGAPEFRRDVQRAAAVLGLTLVEREARTQPDLERVFSALAPGSVDGVFMASLNMRVKFHSLILRLSREHRLPLAGHRREWVQQGALFSYTENIREVGRVAAARYVDKILKGAKPADLPVEAYERPEFVINVKTAKTLGLTIPPSILALADQLFQ